MVRPVETWCGAKSHQFPLRDFFARSVVRGPLWVTTGNALIEHKISALPPKADVPSRLTRAIEVRWRIVIQASFLEAGIMRYKLSDERVGHHQADVAKQAEACLPCVTPSSTSSCDHCSDARTVEYGSAARGLNKI
jgi:hypothetical protein